MIRYATIIGIILTINPILSANSEPLHPNINERSYETAYNESELMADSPIITPKTQARHNEIHYAHVTGYSSTVDQTDDTPFITASGAHVKDGIVAANWLPLGTKIKIPELFGDKVFVVEDRMNKRFSDRLDVWFPDRESAQSLGKKYTKIIVL